MQTTPRALREETAVQPREGPDRFQRPGVRGGRERGGGERSLKDPRGREPAAGLALALSSGQAEAKGKAKAEVGPAGRERGGVCPGLPGL